MFLSKCMQFLFNIFNKKRKRIPMNSVNVVDRKLVEQTTNQFYTWFETEQKHLDGDFVENQAVCFRQYSVWKATH